MEEIQTIILEDTSDNVETVDTLKAQIVILKQVIKDLRDEVVSLRKDWEAYKKENTQPVPVVWKRNLQGVVEVFDKKENN